MMRTQGTPPRQAYNAQTAVNDRQIILAAEITVDAPDFGHLEPMLDTTLAHLERHGVTEQPEAVLADAGYWHNRQIEAITDRGIEVLIPPDGEHARGQTPRLGARPLRADAPTNSPPSAAASSTRSARSPSSRSTGRSNTTGAIDRFMRRGRAAAQSEWRLVAATHNLLKLHSHWIANTA